MLFCEKKSMHFKISCFLKIKTNNQAQKSIELIKNKLSKQFYENNIFDENLKNLLNI